MKRIMLRVAYDGTAYHGWQIQDNAVSVQGELEKALKHLLGENVELLGASRTDAGVHADGNVAVFDADTKIPPEKISYALNQRLPQDIVIQESKEVSKDFHPRYAASKKTYEYYILNRPFPDPIHRRYMHFHYGFLDIAAMQEAAAYLEGEHDFSSFCAANAQVKSKVRTIYSATVSKQDDCITIQLCGNGFLYNMVRIIAGTLIEVGEKKLLPAQIKEILLACERSKAGPTAPACGLHLKRIDY